MARPYTSGMAAVTARLQLVVSVVAATCALTLGCSAFAAPAAAAANTRVSALQTLEGKLSLAPSDAPELKTSDKSYLLAGQSSYLTHTLEDKRLLNREIRVEGRMGAGGSFVVQKLFTVKDGKLYRVRYYCDVCNISAVEPGRCVCCQRPTQLQEIPVANN